MELDVTYQSFFALLRAGLWNREPEGDCFPLSPEVWQRVYKLACKQTVEGIVYDGILQLPEHYFPPKQLLLNWVVTVDSIEKKNKRMNKAIAELSDFFTKNGITAFLMKGQGIAACYHNPLHRVCGDIDLSFPDKKDFTQACRLIMENSIEIEKQAGFSVCYTWKDVLIELHQFFLDISNPFLSNYLCRLQQQEKVHSIYLEVDGRKVLLPSPVLTHVSVNTHILRHLLSFGISIRQLCDSARVCCMYHNSKELHSLKEIYGKSGIYRWIQLLNNLLVNYLGMPSTYLPFPLMSQRKADMMMKDILQSGSFGYFGGPFSKETDEPQLHRKRVWLHLSVRFFRYVRYAPYEACWFPIMHTWSHFKNWIAK